MRTLSVVCALLGCGALSLAAPTWVQFDSGGAVRPGEFSVVSSSPDSTVVELRLFGFFREDTVVSGETYQLVNLCIDGGGLLTTVGSPRVPVLARLIAIPDDKCVDVAVRSLEEESFEGYRIFPYQPPPTDDSGPGGLVLDSVRYTTDELYPDTWAQAAEPMIVRDFRVCRSVLQPVRNNPVTGQLLVARTLRVVLSYARPCTVNVKAIHRPGVSAAFEPLYKTFIANYDLLGSLDPMHGWYLIITPDAFLPAVAPFAEWKNRKGLRAKVVTTTQIGGNDSAHIYDYIHNAYVNWPEPPEFVLLVGDAPGWLRTCHYHPIHTYESDLRYSLHEGDDHLADLLLGRVCCNSLSEAQLVLDKLRRYEEDPPTGDWFGRACALAGYSAGEPERWWLVVVRIRDYVMGRPFAQFDTLFQRWRLNTKQGLRDSLELGRSWMLYRGHGATEPSRWENVNPPWVNADVLALSNGRKLPIVCALTCNVGMFEREPGGCLAETWVNVSYGACGCFAATRPTFPDENDTLAVGMFRHYVDHLRAGFAQCTQAAKLLEYQAFGDLLHIKTYQNFGDPELGIWSAVSRSLSVTHPSLVPVGTSGFPVHVTSGGAPVPDALVCVMSDDDPGTYHVGYTDAAGNILFGLSVAVPGALINVTVTGRNLRPYEGAAAVESPFLVNCATATFPTWARHLARDQWSGALHVVYQSSSAVYYAHSTDNGVTWSHENMGPGQSPSVDLDFHHRPWVVFRRGRQIAAKIRTAAGWQDIVMYQVNLGNHVGVPAFVLSGLHTEAPPYPELDLGYVVFPESVPDPEYGEPPESYVKVIPFDENRTYGEPVLLDRRDQNNYCLMGNASIAKTPGDWLHIVWERPAVENPVPCDDSVFYRTTTRPLLPWIVRQTGLQPIDFTPTRRVSPDPSGGEAFTHPFVEVWGESVHVVFSECVSDPLAIRTTTRSMADPYNRWSPAADVRRAPDAAVDFSVKSTRFVTAWQEEGGTFDGEAVARWTGEDGIENLSKTRGRSRYPHVKVQLYDGSPGQPAEDYVHTVWTEQVIPGDLYLVKYRRTGHVPTPDGGTYYSADLGDTVLSPFCVQREGFRRVGGRGIDYAPECLEYRLPYLDPSRGYRLRLVMLHGGRGRWVQELQLDSARVGEVRFDSARVETAWVDVPRRMFASDAEVSLRVRRRTGQYAALVELALFSVSVPTPGGGQQGAPLAGRPELHACRPSMFRKSALISFSLPLASQVVLSVFDAGGRLVAEPVTRASFASGRHEVLWRGLDRRGVHVPAGVYFVRLRADGTEQVTKVVRLE